jgi:hypothetical protein
LIFVFRTPFTFKKGKKCVFIISIVYFLPKKKEDRYTLEKMAHLNHSSSPSRRRQDSTRMYISHTDVDHHIQWNAIDLLLLFFIVSMGIHSVSGFFSVPAQIIDVSTFSSISTIDSATANGLTSSNYTDTENITAIKLLVFGGEDDIAANSGLDFFGFPPPNTVQGITSAPPQSTPCLNSATADCSTFISNGIAGPIKVQITSTLPTFRYKLTKTTIQVPYAYLDHNAPILYCPPGHGPSGGSNDKNLCDKAPAQYVSYDNNLLLNGFIADDQIGSDPTQYCRGKDNTILGTLEWYNKDQNQDTITPSCFACPITIFRDIIPGVKSTVSHFCPFHASHRIQIPVRDTDAFRGDTKTQRPCNGKAINNCKNNQYGVISTDLASLEDYYYWCYGNSVGTESDIPGDADQEVDAENGETQRGQFFDMVREYDTAYQCTLGRGNSDTGGIDILNCPPYVNVNKLITDYSDQLEQCYLSEEGKADTPECTGSILNQVTAAIRFLTASCDADDSAENMSPATYKIGIAEEDPYGYSCPGSQWGHVRPNIFNPSGGINLARCSAGCSDKNTVTHASEATSKNQWDVAYYTVQSILRDKAAIELGPVTCDVYRIDSRPRAIMDVQIKISAPDGTFITQQLSTEGFDFDTGTLGDAKFSSRINRIEPGAPMGETLDGYIVICGTTDPVNNNVDNAGRDVKNCEGLNAPDAPYFLDDKDLCTFPPVGQIRGVFPREDPNVPGNFLPGIPTINPWSDIINKMADDFGVSCKKNAADCLKGAPNTLNSPSVEEYTAYKKSSCATPTPTYLSVLNCGRRVSWYYVDEYNTQNYGSECGRMGFRNANAQSNGGAQFMCQQGDFTCTPGFGTPRYGTSAGSTRVKSPCQEQGILTRFNQETITPTGCGGSVGRPLNLPPGWTWSAPIDTTPGGHGINDTTDGKDYNQFNVPNMWIDGPYLYRQPANNEGAGLNLEIEIYTNTFFGGSYQTFAPGEIERTDLFYCKSTVDIAQSGRLAVEICNTSPDSGGSYTALTTCGFSDISLQGPNAFNISVTMDPRDAIPISLSAKNCTWEEWSFTTEGPINITQIWCTTTLSQGIAPGLPPLDSVVYSCNISIPSSVDLGKHALFQGANYEVCKGQGDLICHLSQQPDWTQAILYIFLIGLYIFVIIYVYNLVKAAWLTQEDNNIIVKETELLDKKRVIHDENLAELTAKKTNALTSNENSTELTAKKTNPLNNDM